MADLKETYLDNPESKVFTGIVATRKCPGCGHHEVGIITKIGEFLPLRPGTRVQVLEEHAAQPVESEEPKALLEGSHKDDEYTSAFRLWLPDPLRADRSLRLKYAVMVKEDPEISQMSEEIYRRAYLEKLQELIESEVAIPLPVLLDRFFSAPHIASGNPREITNRMWEELEEIRKPVELVKAWLEDPNEERLMNLIQPKSRKDLASPPPNEADLRKELAALSLEEFLSFL